MTTTRLTKLRRALGFAMLVLSGFIQGCADQGPESTESTDAMVETSNSAGPGHVIATYVVSELDEADTRLLVGALAEKQGIVSAQAVPDSSLFRVVFSVEQTSPAEVLSTVSAAVPGITLRDVVQVNGPKGDHACAGCPAKASCSDAH